MCRVEICAMLDRGSAIVNVSWGSGLLDTGSERAVQESLDQLLAGRMSFWLVSAVGWISRASSRSSALAGAADLDRALLARVVQADGERRLTSCHMVDE
jgi:hypothetical protein